MSPLVHLVTAWLVAVIFSLKPNEMRVVVFLGVIADVDGIFLLNNKEMFIQYHHTFGHSYLFAVPLVLVFSVIISRKNYLKLILLSVLAFSLHLFLDIIGTNWPVNPIYPLFHINLSIYPTLSNEIIYYFIDPMVTIGSIMLLILAMVIKERSPIDLVSSKLDSIVMGTFVYPFKHRCKICGRRASCRCSHCKNYYCLKHVNNLSATKCKRCIWKKA